jgi:hypothetical protein
MAQRRAYLNNRDLLHEIHQSKRSYCSFMNEEDFEYDFIVDDIDRMNESRITDALNGRAERLTAIAVRALQDREGISTKAANNRAYEVRVHPNDIDISELVIREMTHSHIPLEEKKGKMVHPSLRFPPFKHYKFIDGQWKEVLRSHWEGGFENGSFCQDQGKMTTKLAKMVMMLVERISHKSNFRGYSYLEDMKSSALLNLAEVALKFDESKGDNPFAYYTSAINNNFKGLLNIEKKHRVIRDDLMMANGYAPSHNAMIEHEMKERKETQKQ